MKHRIDMRMQDGWAKRMLALILLALPLAAAAFNNGSPNFQIVGADSLGQPKAAQAIELMVELTTGSLDGQAQYAETHATQTDPNGVAAIAIGFGKPTDAKYVFDNFDISQGDNFVRISLKEAGGWRLLLKSQMPNVPQVRKWLFADEKSNTVIAVMIIVWLGIVVYLLLSGRKMKQLEKQVAALKQERGSKG